MSHIKSFSPGQLQEDKSTLGYTKEDIRLDQLIPSEILEDRAQLQKFLEKYYEFMNMDEFTFTETETFNDIILDGIGNTTVAPRLLCVIVIFLSSKLIQSQVKLRISAGL